ncbi:MAG TPA: glutamate mutase L, partial [Anaerolineaceae bacterium]|nr:glutamate mutase L [Anaerolineaceae bacterium]
MTAPIVDAESVLALDIGSIHTRALLFDVVDGQYRFIAAGVASSTAAAPFCDVSEGVYQAIGRLQEMTARKLLDSQSQLILPSQPDGSGVDQMAITFSAGPALRVVTLGLLEDVSLESANRLAACIPGKIVESIGLNDRRKTESQIDALLKAQPDLILLAGGTEGGATRSLGRLVDLIHLALQVLPREKRPEVVFAGNQHLAKNIQDALEPLATTETAPNVRPTIDQETFSVAQETIAREVGQIAQRRINGLQSVGRLSSSAPLPAGFAFGRMIRFL